MAALLSALFGAGTGQGRPWNDESTMRLLKQLSTAARQPHPLPALRQLHGDLCDMHLDIAAKNPDVSNTGRRTFMLHVSQQLAPAAASFLKAAVADFKWDALADVVSNPWEMAQMAEQMDSIGCCVDTLAGSASQAVALSQFTSEAAYEQMTHNLCKLWRDSGIWPAYAAMCNSVSTLMQQLFAQAAQDSPHPLLTVCPSFTAAASLTNALLRLWRNAASNVYTVKQLIGDPSGAADPDAAASMLPVIRLAATVLQARLIATGGYNSSSRVKRSRSRVWKDFPKDLVVPAQTAQTVAEMLSSLLFQSGNAHCDVTGPCPSNLVKILKYEHMQWLLIAGTCSAARQLHGTVRGRCPYLTASGSGSTGSRGTSQQQQQMQVPASHEQLWEAMGLTPTVHKDCLVHQDVARYAACCIFNSLSAVQHAQGQAAEHSLPAWQLRVPLLQLLCELPLLVEDASVSQGMLMDTATRFMHMLITGRAYLDEPGPLKDAPAAPAADVTDVIQPLLLQLGPAAVHVAGRNAARRSTPVEHDSALQTIGCILMAQPVAGVLWSSELLPSALCWQPSECLSVLETLLRVIGNEHMPAHKQQQQQLDDYEGVLTLILNVLKTISQCTENMTAVAAANAGQVFSALFSCCKLAEQQIPFGPASAPAKQVLQVMAVATGISNAAIAVALSLSSSGGGKAKKGIQSNTSSSSKGVDMWVVLSARALHLFGVAAPQLAACVKQQRQQNEPLNGVAEASTFETHLQLMQTAVEGIGLRLEKPALLGVGPVVNDEVAGRQGQLLQQQVDLKAQLKSSVQYCQQEQAGCKAEDAMLDSIAHMLAGDVSTQLLEFAAAVFAAVPVGQCCNNVHCSRLAGLSELESVSGKGSRCSKCRVAHYCCRECQVAAWPKHKATCKRLAAMAAGK